MPQSLTVPSPIDAVIRRFDQADRPITIGEIHSGLSAARKECLQPTEAENLGAWAEVLAFALCEGVANRSPWGTYFIPIAEGADKITGQKIYWPDLARATPDVICHWANRARKSTHPVLKARYSDLVWEMTPTISNARRNPLMARCAVDAYLSSATVTFSPELQQRFEPTIRALDLACLIRDEQRIETAKDVLLGLLGEAVDAKSRLWMRAYNRLTQQTCPGITNEERINLVNRIEELVLYFGDISIPEAFDPHDLKYAAETLIKYYSSNGQRDDVARLRTVIGGAFEHFASLGNALLAGVALQTAENEYRQAGLSKDSKRIRVLMEQKNREAREEMSSHGFEFTIPKEEVDEFCAVIVDRDLRSSFARIAAAFLPRRKHLEEELEWITAEAPLMSHITHTIMDGDHVAGTVGPTEEDPEGRLILLGVQKWKLAFIWMERVIERLLETHQLQPEHFVSWANRHNGFEDTPFLLEGVEAWLVGDLVKAVHVLVPQIESGLRAIVARSGRPVTRAHRSVGGSSVSRGMGELLFDEEVTAMLGKDLTLHFRTVFSDPRGMNLRNLVAHGLLTAARQSP